MQTFLPYMSFDDSAAVLDYRRLGKQRVETMQILYTLLGVKVGNHTRREPTGKYRMAYFDPDGYEVDPDEMNPGDVDLDHYTRDLIAVTREVKLPESMWTIEKFHPTLSRVNNPVVGMWRGYEFALLKYQEAVVDAWWTLFGFEDTCLAKMSFLFKHLVPEKPNKIQFPPWLGYEPFHIAHQSNLIRKDPEAYEHLFPRVPDNLPYIYPRGRKYG